MKQSGHILYQDAFDVIYQVDWNTVNGVIDFTTIIQTPFILGEQTTGFVENKILFKYGTVSVHRQALKPLPNGGYEVIAEGESVYKDAIQLNFPCVVGPSDPFKYHLDHQFTDSVEFLVTDGPRWADPSETGDATMVWGDIDGMGNPVTISGTVLVFVDIWS